jgi:phosphoesterase RecJ-like protein
MKKALEEIKKLVAKSKTAVIATHTDPDGDAVGSQLALGMILERMGLSVTLYCADDVPRIYKFLRGSEKIKKEVFPQNHFDIAFVVDCSDLCRTGKKIDLRKIAPVLVNIDHHPDNKNFGDINYVLETSSVAEEVYDVCKYLKLKIDLPMAECLYTAMITDNGNFRYEHTDKKTFMIAAELVQTGIKTHELTTKIYDSRSLPAIKIAAAVMSELKMSPDHKIAWAAATQKMIDETSARGEDLIGIVDRIRSIEGVEVAVFFREDRDRVKLNLRSKERMNVSEIARRFGGGGHAKAAGAVIEGPLDKVQERVIGEIQKQIEALKFLA